MQDWGDNVCWMNPPYGPQIGAWMEKAYVIVSPEPPSSRPLTHRNTLVACLGAGEGRDPAAPGPHPVRRGADPAGFDSRGGHLPALHRVTDSRACVEHPRGLGYSGEYLYQYVRGSPARVELPGRTLQENFPEVFASRQTRMGPPVLLFTQGPATALSPVLRSPAMEPTPDAIRQHLHQLIDQLPAEILVALWRVLEVVVRVPPSPPPPAPR